MSVSNRFPTRELSEQTAHSLIKSRDDVVIPQTLPQSALSVPAMTSPPHPPIIDTHIHLYPLSEAPTLAWYTPTGPLSGQHSVADYQNAIHPVPKTIPSPYGFVFIETDRRNNPSEIDPTGWTHPLEEVDWITRVARGLPRKGEGHSAEHARSCLAIVPWAPLPSGSEALEQYVKQVMERAGDVAKKVVGWRYLVQDKPRGTMLQSEFIDNLRWLGRRVESFDVGVDARSGGIWQLEEAVQMVRMAHEGVEEREKVVFVLSK